MKPRSVARNRPAKQDFLSVKAEEKVGLNVKREGRSSKGKERAAQFTFWVRSNHLFGFDTETHGRGFHVASYKAGVRVTFDKVLYSLRNSVGVLCIRTLRKASAQKGPWAVRLRDLSKTQYRMRE